MSTNLWTSPTKSRRTPMRMGDCCGPTRKTISPRSSSPVCRGSDRKTGPKAKLEFLHLRACHSKNTFYGRPCSFGRLFRPPALHLQLIGRRSLCGRQARREHAERRTRHVVQSHLVAKLHRRRLPAMLTADPHLEVGPRLAPALGGDLH